MFHKDTHSLNNRSYVRRKPSSVTLIPKSAEKISLKMTDNLINVCSTDLNVDSQATTTSSMATGYS